jgi:hypothetical protein
MGSSTTGEANSHSASQEMPRPSRKPNLHYRIHKSQPLIPILTQMNPIHNFLIYSTKTHTKIVLASTPMSLDWSLLYRYSDKNVILISYLIHPCYMLISSNPILYHLISLIIFGEAYKLRSSSLRNLLQLPATYFILGPNILLSTLF